MKYGVQIQYADRGQRPQDPGPITFNFESDKAGSHLLPNVGDAVHVGKELGGDGAEGIDGVVRSRTFFYQVSAGEMFCHVNIVVEEAPDLNWGLLIKE